MPKHDSFLLRIDPQVLKALKQWAADELRSANGQIEFLLREALVKAQRLPSVSTASGDGSDSSDASGADSRGSKS